MKFIVNNIASYAPRKIRYRIFKHAGIQTESYLINGGCYFSEEVDKIKIGKDTFINDRCFFDGTGGITIGDNCAIAFEVMFCTSSHKTDDPVYRAGGSFHQPIHVGNKCWIGARSVILPGVTIGDGCIIAAGSVVTSNCAANCLYAGTPARKIKPLHPLNEQAVELIYESEH